MMDDMKEAADSIRRYYQWGEKLRVHKIKSVVIKDWRYFKKPSEN